MTKLKILAIATTTLALACGAATAETTIEYEQFGHQATSTQSAPNFGVLGNAFRLSQAATCIHDGERYSEGARLCMGGVWQYCNSRGLWEPSKQSC
jgi:hypothetical protein